jgi:NAD-dependent SIR2 family protein deacetylase
MAVVLTESFWSSGQGYLRKGEEHELDLVIESVSAGDLSVLTGAGMSTASGLPISGEGWTLEAERPPPPGISFGMEIDRAEFVNFYRYRIRMFEGVNQQGHHILAEWEARGLLKGVITQNVDGLHRRRAQGRSTNCTATSEGSGAPVAGPPTKAALS